MTTPITSHEALRIAVSRTGSQVAFAEALRVSQGTVSKWIACAGRLPAEHVLTVERLTGVSRHDLRPDIYPREEMTDQLVGDRFCGIDRQIVARRTPEMRAPAAAEMRKAG